METDFAARNQACLSAGLAWLRACLAAHAPAQAATAMGGGAWWSFARRPAPDTRMLPAPGIASLRDAYLESLAADPQPALAELSRRLGLSPFERDMLLLALAPEIDAGMPSLLAAAQGDPSRRAATFALGMSLLEAPAWDALAPGRPLRRYQLIEIHQAGVTPLLSAPLRIDERIAAYLKGLNYLDERIAAHAVPVPPVRLPPSQRNMAERLAGWLSGDAQGRVQLKGADSASKHDVLSAACALADRQLLSVAAADLPTRAEDIDAFARLWARESALLSLALLVEHAGGGDEEDGGGHRPAFPERLLRRLSGCVFIDVRHPVPGVVPDAVVEIAPPTTQEREMLWRGGFADQGLSPDAAALQSLAQEFRLAASSIERIAAGVAHAGSGTDPARRAWDVCVADAAAGLHWLAQSVEPRATLETLSLPAHDKVQLERLVAHARRRATVQEGYGFGERGSRGMGLTALFHGESGTGKTMAAEAVAHALSLSLFRVDLSAVVSKYIGETSRNLRRVFDAAEGGGTVLLFDEADAVFGKRSEVKDSHDRFANIDINYLLTRMENFGGVTLLATNMKHALDPAFLRRLRFIVGFPFPGVPERRAIWSGAFPSEARTAALDLDHLARFALTGGGIFNAALAAAHAAACEDAPIGMGHVLDAIRWELQKAGRPLAEHEFRTPASMLAVAT